MCRRNKLRRFKKKTACYTNTTNVECKNKIIGASETISKSFRKYLSNIAGKHEIKEIQKTTILWITNILRKVLSKSGKHGRGNITNTMNCNYRIAATLYNLQT
jgi:hypothetical protein